MNQALSDWQVGEIRKGLEEADRGEFASEQEVRKALEKYLVGLEGSGADPSPRVKKHVREV